MTPWPVKANFIHSPRPPDQRYNRSMLILKQGVVGVPIMSLQTGEEIARTESPIIDPRQLVIMAFYCEGPRLDFHPSVLHTDDIREISELGFIVNSADALMSPEDLVRLKEVIGLKFRLDDKPVVDEDGNKLGKVHDYGLDNRTFQIMQIRVVPPLWQALQTTELIIGRNQIIEVTDSEIVVRSPSERATEAAAEPLTNPFRRAPTQPEVSPATTTDQAPL